MIFTAFLIFALFLFLLKFFKQWLLSMFLIIILHIFSNSLLFSCFLGASQLLFNDTKVLCFAVISTRCALLLRSLLLFTWKHSFEFILNLVLASITTHFFILFEDVHSLSKEIFANRFGLFFLIIWVTLVRPMIFDLLN